MCELLYRQTVRPEHFTGLLADGVEGGELVAVGASVRRLIPGDVFQVVECFHPCGCELVEVGHSGLPGSVSMVWVGRGISAWTPGTGLISPVSRSGAVT